MTAIDEYLAELPLSQRTELVRIRTIVKQVVPDAEESISYNMPTLKYEGKAVIHFAAFKNHMSIFGNINPFKQKLTGFKLSNKSTLQFTEDNPVPEDVIKEMVLARMAKISADQ